MITTTLTQASIALWLLAAPSASAAQDGAGSDAAGEPSLATEAALDAVLSLALRQNPDLRESDHRAAAATERANLAGRLPDLQFRYQLWNAPISKPLSPDMHMFGVTQEFPAPGARAARTEAGEHDARASREARRARAEQVATDVRKAFAAYYQADRQLAIRSEHLRLTHHLVDLARANYQAGRATQQDVLRASVEVARLQTDLASVEQQRRSAQALLNGLMGRDADAPLGPPRDLPVPPAPAQADGASRPELVAAEQAVARGRAQLRAVEREANVPSFMLGVDYMYAPMAADPHAYSAMVGVSLPWLNGRHQDEQREARASLAADEAALRSSQIAARYQVADAEARLQSARRTFDAIESEQLELARRSFEAAQAGFAAGQTDALNVMDAERAWLQVRLEREAALARLVSSQADLARAAGLATAGLPEAH